MAGRPGPRDAAPAPAPGSLVLAVVVGGFGIDRLARDAYEDNPSRFAEGYAAGQLAQLVEREGLDHGYSGYWTAANVTFASRFAAKTYPVQPCGAGVCAFRLHRLDAWYVPREGVRTFYAVDELAPEPRVGPPPAEWDPVKNVQLGQLLVYVFNYDIASRIQPDPKDR